VIVPDVTGMDHQDASRILSESGFAVYLSYTCNDTIVNVIDQYPAAGGEAPVGSTVTIECGA